VLDQNSNSKLDLFVSYIDEHLNIVDTMFDFVRTAYAIWSEEDRDLSNICSEYLDSKMKVIGSRASSGDRYAEMFIDLYHYMHDKFRESMIYCPYPHDLFDEIELLILVLYDMISNLGDPQNLIPDQEKEKLGDISQEECDKIKQYVENYKNKYIGMFIKLLLELDFWTRKWIVMDLKDLVSKNQIANIIPVEVLNILEKPVVEIKIDLEPEEAIELVMRYGERWREEIKRIIIDAIKTKQMVR